MTVEDERKLIEERFNLLKKKNTENSNKNIESRTKLSMTANAIKEMTEKDEFLKDIIDIERLEEEDYLLSVSNKLEQMIKNLNTEILYQIEEAERELRS